MADATYYRVLVAVKGLLQAAGAGLPGSAVTLRKAPQLFGLIARLPEVVVAPADRLAERIDALAFANTAIIDYPVWVGLIAEARHDDESLALRLLHRERCRLALFRPLVLFEAGVTEEFDVDYDPAPGDPSAGSVPPTLDATWQLFTFRLDQPRSSPAP